MLKLYCTQKCPRCSRIADALKDMSLAHEVVLCSESSECRGDLPADTDLPVLVDDNKVIQGQDAILRHLEELEAFKELWYKFQSDACYCDEAGDVE